MDIRPSERFIFNNNFAVTDRYAAEADYFKSEVRVNQNTVRKNFVADALEEKASQQLHRAEGATGLRWIMSENSMLSAHVSEMEAGMYKEAHRHEGTLFVPPIYWYHQHFNPGSESARYLAINTPYLVQNLGLRFIDQLKEDLPEVEKEWKQEGKKRARNGQQ